MRQYGFTYVRDCESIPLALRKQNYSHMTWYFVYTLAGAGYWIFVIPEMVRVARWTVHRLFIRLVKQVTTLVSKVPLGRVSEIIAVEGGKPNPSQRGKIGESEQTA